MVPHTLSSCLFFFPSVCYADFSNFAEGYRAEFSKYQAESSNRQSSRSNLKSWMELGGWDPPKGLFVPHQNAPANKKVAVNHAKLCETYSPWSNKIFCEKFLDQGHPQVELLTKMFGRISRKSQYSLLLDSSVGRALLGWALSRLADCDFCCMMRTTVANKKLSRR